MVNKDMKFRLNFLQEISLERKHTSARYYIALNLFDLTSQGWVSKSDFIPFIAKKFKVTEKTVKNNLQKLHTLKWVNNRPDRVYYRNQEFVLSTMHPHQRINKAVFVTMKNITGDIVEFRAFLHECMIAGMIKDKSVTIARDTIHDQLNGHSRHTQRKYEKLRGMKPVTNFARLDGDDALELTYKVGQPVFPILPEDITKELFHVRQLPNTYTSKIKIGKRVRRRKYGTNKTQMPTMNVKSNDKLYFNKGDKTKNVRRVAYLKTKDYIIKGSLWDETYIE